MGYKTKSMIYAKSLEANLNIEGGEKEKRITTYSGVSKEEGKRMLDKARNEVSNDYFAGEADKAIRRDASNKLIKTDSKKTKAKEAGAYSRGTKLLDKTGQDAGVLSGLASDSPGTQVGTAIGIMVNKMDKSPRSTAKFDSKIKEAQGRGNLAKAARLEKREAGYAYRQEKRATRIDPTYKGKTDNTKAKKLEAGKIRRASTAAAAKPKTTPVISEARKKASNKYFAGESDRATKGAGAGATTTGSTKKQGPSNVKPSSNSVGKNTVLRNSDPYKSPKTYSQKMKDLSKYKVNPDKNSTGNAATQHSLTKKPGSQTGKQGPDNVSTGAGQGSKTTNPIPSKNTSPSFGSNEWFKIKNKQISFGFSR